MMDYDPMVMDDAESLGPAVKISQVRHLCRDRRYTCLLQLVYLKTKVYDPVGSNTFVLVGRLDARQVRALQC